jgi:PAS domain S-box-containing protein
MLAGFANHAQTMPSHRKLPDPELGPDAAAHRDDTMANQAEAALRASEERLRTIYQHAPMGIIQVDPAKGALEMVNPAFCDMLGYSEAELAGRPLAEITHPDDRAADQEGFRRIMAGDIDFYHAVKRYIRKDGRFVWAQVHAAVLRDPEGRARFNVGVVSDITDLRQAEEEAREHLEEASRLQRLHTVNELATLLAHELNQPLAAIATYTEVGRQLLRGSSLDQVRLAGNLEKIGQQALRAGDIIRHLRSFVRRRPIDPEPLDLHEVVRGACDLMAPEARKGGIRLELRLDPNPSLVIGVSVQVEQVLLNLLRNAFDAIDDAGMRGGTVTVTTQRAGDKVRVTVSDSGPGIDAEAAARLFEPLSSRKVDGLGVGLRISRSPIAAHGGRLWVEPRVPGGVFHFELSLAP